MVEPIIEGVTASFVCEWQPANRVVAAPESSRREKDSGAPLGDALRDNLPFGSAFVVAWTVIRWTLGIAALTGLFATIYYLAPNRETPKWAWVSPGGILAAAIWLMASLGFSFYVSSFGNYKATFGPLAGVAVLLLWLYLTALAVILGGELNAELERQSAARKGQVPSDAA